MTPSRATSSAVRTAGVRQIFWGIVQLLIGLLLVWGVASEAFEWLSRRSRLRRTTGVVVGSVDTAVAGPGNTGRSGVFQFRTDRGEVVQFTSSFYAGRGPRVGRSLPVLYDPADPHKHAERRDVLIAKAAMALPMLALAVFFVGLGLTNIF